VGGRGERCRREERLAKRKGYELLTSRYHMSSDSKGFKVGVVGGVGDKIRAQKVRSNPY
jgi:hypothetical protein